MRASYILCHAVGEHVAAAGGGFDLGLCGGSAQQGQACQQAGPRDGPAQAGGEQESVHGV